MIRIGLEFAYQTAPTDHPAQRTLKEEYSDLTYNHPFPPNAEDPSIIRKDYYTPSHITNQHLTNPNRHYVSGAEDQEHHTDEIITQPGQAKEIRAKEEEPRPPRGKDPHPKGSNKFWGRNLGKNMF
jgi:DNA polymerase sigma